MTLKTDTNDHDVGSPDGTDGHEVIWPPILYFGTPIALVTTLNADGSANIGPMSSAWALGYTVVMGWESTAHTLANLERERECVINLPDRRLVEQVEVLAPLTGSNPPAAHKADKFRFEPRKFDAAGLTEHASETVKPPRIAECPLQLEAKVTAIHEPATRPDGAYFRIAEAHVQRVHALPAIIKPGTSHVDPDEWRPLFYVFRHYFSTGPELARSFRAED
ncbi:MAG TPA: flavin reductase family protein [Solirubrobacteraceae bacterium]|nr:flavin reductase family protein [Solirubrobacteraceae bacterium]